MANQKLENLLNLALAATQEEKEKSQDLSIGFIPETRSWELIVKYHGQLERLSSPVIQIESLINSYAIVTIREDFIEPFSQLDEVEYIESPKRLFFA